MTYTVGANPYPAIVCLGDSQTQFAFGPRGYVGQLAEAYQRKADVINRGYSGYTTRDTLPLVKHVFSANATGQRILAVTVWLGCNDSIDQGQKQYVSEEDYASNLTKILQAIKPSSHAEGQQGAEPFVVVMGPTPVTTRDNHRNERKVTYTDIARKVAESSQCAFLDTYELFQKDKQPLEKLLDADGIHIAPPGYDLLFRAVLSALEKHGSGRLAPSKLPFVFPEYHGLSSDPEVVAQQVVPHGQGS
ncbi:unnamed protein product [Parajaminaea phylloscopi]